MEEDHSIKAVIWDMGGVLLRSENYQSRERLASQFKITEAELERVVFNSESAEQATLGRISQNEHWRNTAFHFGLKEEEAARLEEEFWEGDQCDYELVGFIRSLRPGIKIGLLSNAWMGTRENLAFKHKILDAFDVAMFSYEVGLAKPDFRIYHAILEKLEASPQNTIFVDDFIGNVKAAMALGIHGIHFHSREQVIGEINQLIHGWLPGSQDQNKG